MGLKVPWQAVKKYLKGGDDSSKKRPKATEGEAKETIHGGSVILFQQSHKEMKNRTMPVVSS